MNTRRYQIRAITRGLPLALASLLLPGALLAQAPAAPGPMTFADMDKNGDGIVTGPEFATAHAARAAQGAPMPVGGTAVIFADFDQNGDGQLTIEEFQAGRQARMQGRPGMGGGPGAGMGGGPGRGMGMGRNMPTFAEFDLNGDGTLTEAEFTQARAQRMAGRAAQGYPMRNAGNAPAFSTIDADGNGQVTPAEFAAGQAAHRQQMRTQP